MPGFDNFTSFGSEAIQRFKKDAARAFGAQMDKNRLDAARARLEAKAAQGDVEALKSLGLLYLTGAFGDANRGRAFPLLDRAAATGDPDALHYFSACWSVGIGCERNERKGLELCARAAKLGCVRAIIDMGISYSEGHGVPKDPVKAARCFQLAVDKGSGDACGELAHCYLFGEGVAKDSAKAKQLLELGVERGSGHCAHNLGVGYLECEWSEEPDFARARDCFEQSCALGGRAYYDLAMMCLQGIGIPIDYHKGLNVLKRGAEADDPESLVELGKLYIRNDDVWQKIYDPAEGYRCLLRACELGYGPAFMICADLYEEGCGVPSDPARAIKILELGVEHNDAESAFRLGVYYEGGQNGLRQDSKRALELFELAFENGSPDAAAYLGSSYKNGDGVPQDVAKALRYLTVGAEMGSGACLYELATCYADGVGVPEDRDKYIKLLFEAADRDFPLAVGEIGMSYFDGYPGFEKDYEEAVDYLERAVELGLDECLPTLAKCYQKGLGVEKDKSKAKELLRRAKEAGVK